MKIYALVGPSGSGKSHRSQWIAKQKNIEYIIDDGLLIKGSSVVAGRSAKREKTKVASVKAAVFVNDDHAFEVSHALKVNHAESLLILGTSDGMVKKIAERLGVGEINEIIRITDIATPEEINYAISTRRNQGKHVIPVPTMELKKDFSGFYLDPLNALKKAQTSYADTVGDKSVVRPTFSYLGKYTISEYAVYQIAEQVLKESGDVHKVNRFNAKNSPGGINIEIDVVIKYGNPLPELLKQLRSDVIEKIEFLTSINVKNLVITASGLI